MRLNRAVFNLEKVLLIRVWKLSNPQFPISKLALLLCFRDSWKNASSKYSWAKQSEISCPCHSRDARFELWRFDFTQKATCLSKAWRSANWIWQFLNQALYLTACVKFSLHTNSEGLFQSKTYFCLGSRRTESLIWSASILEMPDLELWRFAFIQKTASLSKAWSTANSVWTAFGATSWMNWVTFSSPFDSRDARLELWRFDFSQKASSLSKAWHTVNSVWTAFGENSWMNCVKFSSPLDSRDARFGALKVCFQSKNGFSLESMTHCKFSLNSFWSKFLNELCQIFFSVRFSRCQIWSSEGLISVKKRLLSRKHDALQIQFEQLFEQILEMVLSSLLLHSILEMRIRALNGIIPQLMSSSTKDFWFCFLTQFTWTFLNEFVELLVSNAIHEMPNREVPTQ